MPERPRNEQERQRSEEDHRAVTAAEAFDPLLGFALALLRLLDKVDNFGERVIGERRGGLDLKRPLAVDGRREDFLARPFVYRHRLAGHRRFIEARLTYADNTIGRQGLTGAHEEAVTGFESLSRNSDFLSITQDMRLLGRKVKQRADRVTRAGIGVFLQSLG